MNASQLLKAVNSFAITYSSVPKKDDELASETSKKPATIFVQNRQLRRVLPRVRFCCGLALDERKILPGQAIRPFPQNAKKGKPTVENGLPICTQNYPSAGSS